MTSDKVCQTSNDLHCDVVRQVSRRGARRESQSVENGANCLQLKFCIYARGELWCEVLRVHVPHEIPMSCVTVLQYEYCSTVTLLVY